MAGTGVLAQPVVGLADIVCLVNRLPHLAGEAVLSGSADLFIPHLHGLPAGGAVDKPVEQVIERAGVAFHKGEALLQKTFTVDYLTKEVRKNNGEVPSVRVRNSHEPIIEPEVFDRVQAILAESAKRRAKVRTRHPFAGKLVCGDCGSFYGHKVWRLRSTGERYNVWYCNHKYDGDKTCDSPRLRDEEIKAAFEKMLQKCSDANPVYTDERWNKLVESVKVCRGGHLIFTLTDGRIVKVTLQDH